MYGSYYVYDPISGTTKSLWDFGNEDYNGEFEALFSDLTVTRDPSDNCKGIKTQIVVSLI